VRILPLIFEWSSSVAKAIIYPPLEIPYTGHYLAGVDEVGRGPLIGDVVAAAVILDPTDPIEGLTDSKALSEKKREFFDALIREKSLAFAIGRASPEEIDELNIYHATHLAMCRAIDALIPAAEYLLVDGNRMPDHALPGMPIVKGDLRHPAISAASIIAKVARDHDMVALDAFYPEFGLAQHKGYPTKAHLAALEQYGVLPQHRRSFGPVKRTLVSAERTSIIEASKVDAKRA